MKQNLYILLLSLLLLVASTFSVSAQTVDVQEQSMDTMLYDSVENNMTALYVVDDVVNIYQTTNATDSLVNEQKEKSLWWKENFGILVGNEENATKIQLYIKDVMVIFISVLSVLAFIIALIIMLRNNDDITKVRWIQTLWISVIVLITIYSGSQWAYIVLIALCVLEIFQYNPELLETLNKILRSYSGVRSANDDEINSKIENEVEEVAREDVSQSVSSSEGSQEGLQKDRKRTINHYRDVESLALDFLGRKYPKLQRYVIVQTEAFRRLVLDGFIEKWNKNIIVEVKYYPISERRMPYLKPLYETMDYLTKKTKKRTELLLFIVTSTPNMKSELEKQFADVEHITNIEIYTEEELRKQCE